MYGREWNNNNNKITLSTRKFLVLTMRFWHFSLDLFGLLLSLFRHYSFCCCYCFCWAVVVDVVATIFINHNVADVVAQLKILSLTSPSLLKSCLLFSACCCDCDFYIEKIYNFVFLSVCLLFYLYYNSTYVHTHIFRKDRL